MRLSQLQSEDIDASEVQKYIVFHDHLNPKFWTETNRLKPLIRLLLLKSALEFYKFIDLPGLRVQDVILTGSNASFNYTELSDLDVHLVVDFTKASCPDLMENFFFAKKSLWNNVHDVTILGQNVELYVQDKHGLLEANGVYSLLKGEWEKEPKREKPLWNDMAVVAKTDQLASEIQGLLAGKPTLNQINDLLSEIRQMRQCGLENGGEFSTENLTFKALRNLGLLEKLFKERTRLQDKALSR